jgi:hypothetical protein
MASLVRNAGKHEESILSSPGFVASLLEIQEAFREGQDMK